MSEEKLSAEDKVKLAMLEAAAKQGAPEGELKYMLAAMSGEPMASFDEVNGGRVYVKVNRVWSVWSNRDGTTNISFDHGGPDARRVVVDHELHKVVGRLRESGWSEGE